MIFAILLSRDMGHNQFYFQRYRILCLIFLFAFRDMGYLGIFAIFWDTCLFTSRDM